MKMNSNCNFVLIANHHCLISFLFQPNIGIVDIFNSIPMENINVGKKVNYASFFRHFVIRKISDSNNSFNFVGTKLWSVLALLRPTTC